MPKASQQIKEHIVPILINQAQLEMMRMYKAGMVEPIGEATIGITMSTEPIRSIEGMIRRDFYACYKIAMPIKPTIPLKDPSCKEILQDHVSTNIRFSNINFKDIEGTEHALIIYLIDFWITREGEVWKEDDENLWRRILQLPKGLLQLCYLNLRSAFNIKYIT